MRKKIGLVLFSLFASASAFAAEGGATIMPVRTTPHHQPNQVMGRVRPVGSSAKPINLMPGGTRPVQSEKVRQPQQLLGGAGRVGGIW